MSATRALMLLALVVLAGCGGDGAKAEPAAVPKGFKLLDGPTYTFAYPEAWSQVKGEGILGAQGPKDATGLAPQAAAAYGPGPGVSLDIAIDGFKADNSTRRGNWKVTREEDYKLDGAEEARLIEARYLAVTGDDTTPVRSIDVLARDAKGNQYDFIVRAAEADFDRLRMQEVLDTFRLK